MSWRAAEWAWGQQVEPAAKLVLLALARSAEAATGRTFVSPEGVAELCGISVRAVEAEIEGLVRRGIVISELVPVGEGFRRQYIVSADR